MMQLIICSSLFREASLHDFGICLHMFLIGGQIKIKFSMGSSQATCTKFSGRSHDVLNFAEKHICRRAWLFICLRYSSFEFNRRKKVRICFFKKRISLLLNFGLFFYSGVLNGCKFVGEPMQNQIQTLHISTFLRKIAW